MTLDMYGHGITLFPETTRGTQIPMTVFIKFHEKTSLFV